MDLKSVINTLSSPIITFSPMYDENNDICDFKITFQNDAFIKMAGHVVKDSKSFFDFKDKVTSGIPWWKMAMETMNGTKHQDCTFYSPATRSWYKVDMHLSDDKNIVVSFSDITVEKNYTQRLKESALRDSLTGLINRIGFLETINIVLETAQYEKRMVAVLVLDVDDLKKINEADGTDAGDEVLKKTVAILKRFQRDSIKIFRYGGDEFIVLISEVDSMDAIVNITDTIYEAFQNEQIFISGGIAVAPEHTEQKDELLRFADMSVHHSKKNGKNQFTFFTFDMEREFVQQLTMQTKMTSAVLKSSFNLYYQPQFDVKTSQLRGFEALIRWTDPELGSIPPSIFIPIAEENGLIIQIGNWVLKTAVQTLCDWQKKFNFEGILSVNISPVQLKQRDFIDNLVKLVKTSGVNTRQLEIEITEGVLIHNMEDVIEKLSQIREMGIKISLDDFGTGYASLSYLQALPLNTLKIDKAFVNNITSKDGVQAIITSSIINMVSNMGLETIAEGVEEQEQLALLEKFNCNVVQGYLHGKPMPFETCEKYLSGDKSALIKM